MILSEPTVVLDIPEGRQALESRVGTDPLDVLQATRRALLEQLAPLKALHGPFGAFDDKRKQMVEACKVRARIRLTAGGAKATEAWIESEGYADPEYVALLDSAIRDKVQYLKLENEVTEITERIRSRELEIGAYTGECRLQR